MSGTRKKQKKTTTSTGSLSVKRRRSSTTRTPTSNQTPTSTKSGSELQAGRKEIQKNSSLFSSTVPRQHRTKKSIELSAQDALLQKRREIWKGYDDESLPELNDAQIVDLAENSIPYRDWLKERRKRRAQRPES